MFYVSREQTAKEEILIKEVIINRVRTYDNTCTLAQTRGSVSSSVFYIRMYVYYPVVCKTCRKITKPSGVIV